MDDLLRALTAERYNGFWWPTRREVPDDSELTCARRRKVLAEAWDEMREREAG